MRSASTSRPRSGSVRAWSASAPRRRSGSCSSDVPGDYVKINSGLGESPPLNIIVLPVLFEGSLRAVVELASFSRFNVTHQAFLDSITESIGIVLSTIQAAGLTEALLKQSQSQAEELRAQQEELRGSNADLARQAKQLAEQNLLAEQKNLEVEESKRLVEEKVSQLAVSSKYKSEFIANMSHELRTPLNSLLILAQQLEENPDGNMTATQVEYASVVHASGKELLGLLNSILDLAKVESGTVIADNTEVPVADLRAALLREFGVVAQRKSLGYSIDIMPGCPDIIVTDQQRLRQILKNLLANAFKFTERGRVDLLIGPADHGWSADNQALADASSVVALSVVDSGIGISAEQQLRIFEAFAQGDGTTARRYGGTGLGLSISRELATLLGGEVNVVSTPERGSTFTVYLPAVARGARSATPAPPMPSLARSHYAGGEPSVARSHNPTPERTRPRPAAKGVQARNGRVVADAPRSEALPTAPQRSEQVDAPSVAKPSNWGIGQGLSPIEGVKILVVDDNIRNIYAMTALLERGHAEVTIVESGADCIATLLRSPDIDIVLMDIMMPIMDGYDTIRALRAMPQFASLPVVAVTGKAVAGERQRCLDAGASDYVPKPVAVAELLAALRPWLPATLSSRRTSGIADPPTRPADGTDPPPPARHAEPADPPAPGLATEPPDAHRATEIGSGIEGVKILLVDDDFRNIFAMTALLERGHADVLVAESGSEALAIMERESDIAIVLMDIMMPIMDGYETIRAIRAIDRFVSLPIVAITGKSASGERQRCLDAGANDYLPKPVDTAALLEVLGSWLQKLTQRA